MILRNISWRLTMVPLTGLLLALGAPAGAQTTHHPSKRVKFGHLASGPNAVSQDFGDVAVIVDNGLIVNRRNLFDLPSNTTLRFEPASGHAYSVSTSQAGMDPNFGPGLAFGFPDAPYTLDD